ncbi:MAG: carbonic anhydrase family protein [Thermomicrobiales bacterium]|nr:carbonic anhydrase family protein [Thermomicrobiales bacterium]
MMTDADPNIAMLMNRRRFAHRSALIAGAALLGASASTAIAQSTPEAEEEPPHWNYEGDNGPEEWGSLDESYAACDAGSAQSPIDIAGAGETEAVDVAVDFATIAPMRIINNGHTVQVNIDPGSSAEIDSVHYNLLQFHFHAPSEHAIDGERQAMELHFVHKTDETATAVLGLLLREGQANAALEPVFANMPAEAGDEQSVDVELDLAAVLPSNPTTFRYGGSLTTPPCTEGVSWIVFAEPVEISTEQLAIFQAIHPNNARPLQEVNDRDVELDAAD